MRFYNTFTFIKDSAVFVDAVAIFIPGMLRDQNSIKQNKVASSKVYTRPATIKFKNKKLTVPKVLLSGDHKKLPNNGRKTK